MQDQREHIFCPECGAVLEQVMARVERLEEAQALLEKDIAGKRSEIKRLQRQQDERVRDAESYETACEVALYWQRVCEPKAREPLNVRRLEPTLARLNHYTPAELRQAIDGYAARPYVVNGRRVAQGAPDQRYCDLDLIMRDAKHVDTGLRIAEREQQYREVLAEGGPAEPEEMNAQLELHEETPSLGDIGQRAIRYARHGWYVFPCRPRDKQPATANGLKDATLDLDRITRFWIDHPEHNVAIRTGAESGIVVLDVDGEEGMESLRALERINGTLPETASVLTPRGGQHYYFRHPGGAVPNTAGVPGPGLDIRGDGGYVLAPPSVGPGGRSYVLDDEVAIAPMPDWLLQILQRYHDRKGPIVARDWAAYVTEGATQGERDTRMTSYVGHLFAHGHDEAEILALAVVLNRNVRPPLADKDLQRIVQSIGRRHRRSDR